jgi:hypothetical protein
VDKYVAADRHRHVGCDTPCDTEPKNP